MREKRARARARCACGHSEPKREILSLYLSRASTFLTFPPQNHHLWLKVPHTKESTWEMSELITASAVIAGSASTCMAAEFRGLIARAHRMPHQSPAPAALAATAERIALTVLRAAGAAMSMDGWRCAFLLAGGNRDRFEAAARALTRSGAVRREGGFVRTIETITDRNAP